MFPASRLVAVVGSFSQSRIREQKALEIPVQTSIVRWPCHLGEKLSALRIPLPFAPWQKRPLRSECIILPYGFVTLLHSSSCAPLRALSPTVSLALAVMIPCNCIPVSVSAGSLLSLPSASSFSPGFSEFVVARKKYATFTNRTQQKVEVISGSPWSLDRISLYARCLLLPCYCRWQHYCK